MTYSPRISLSSTNTIFPLLPFCYMLVHHPSQGSRCYIDTEVQDGLYKCVKNISWFSCHFRAASVGSLTPSHLIPHKELTGLVTQFQHPSSSLDMSQDVSQPCPNWFVFLPNEWKCYLAKWVWGTNCTYHQKSSLENSFQTYAWGNEPVSLPVCHSTLCYSGCVPQAGIAFLMRSLLVCSESVSAQSQAAFGRMRSCWAASAIPSLLCSSPTPQFLPLLSPAMSFFSVMWEWKLQEPSQGSPSSPLPGTTAANPQWCNSAQVHSENRCEVFRKLSLLLMKSPRASCAWHQFSQRFVNGFFPPLEIFVTVDYFTLCCCM